MQFDFPTTLLGWASLLGVIAVGLSIIYFQFRNQTTNLMRLQIDDMTKRIKFLEEEVDRLKIEKDTIDGEYKNLKFKKNYLKQIVIEALASKKGIDESLLKEITTDVILKTNKKS